MGNNAVTRICPGSAPSCQGRQGKDGASDSFLLLEDDSGASSVTYSGATGLFLGDFSKVCSLSYDVRMFNDNGNLPNVHVPWSPQFTIGNNSGLTAVFTANFTITEDGGPNPGWFNVRVPTGLSSAGALPTSPDGSWAVFLNGTPSTSPAQHWDQLIQNVTKINWPTDINSLNSSGGQSSGPFEVFGYDNFCRGECDWPPTGGDDASGIVKICKVAADGVKRGANFNFSAGDRTVTVPAGPGPDGYCAIAGTDFPVGKTVRVTETGPYGYGVTEISVAPRERQAGRADLGRKLVDVLIGAGVTEVTFVNEKRTGYLEICKTGDATGDFVFDIPSLGQRFTVPAGACTPAIEVAAGDLEIVEQTRAGAAMRGCRTLPDGRLVSCNTRRQTAVVRIEAGDISTQTILLVENRATGAKPDPSGPAPADSTSTPAPVDTTPADPGVDTPTVPQSPIGRRGAANSRVFGEYSFADFARRPVETDSAYVTLACRPGAERILCTATANSHESGAERPGGFVAFRRAGATIATMPLKRDGSASLILPYTDAIAELEAAFVEAPLLSVGQRDTGGFRFYKPGETAPDDNSAARLNCGIVSRASGLFSLTLRERCAQSHGKEAAQ